MASRPPEPALALRGVCKAFGPAGHRHRVLSEVSLELQRGEMVAIIGFSGSGKTTLLSIAAGLLAPDAGSVLMDGVPAGGPGPDRGVVFQSYALLPWLSVLANVQLAVDAAHPRWPRRERYRRALELVEKVGLGAAREKRPRELSGGMRQRVAVARALALDPRILLLDEPLGALDALTRAGLQREIARLFEGEQRSAILVTNDVDEAILLADRIVPLTPGPGATLGPSFHVALPRPRERAALNHDPEFRKLRNEITAHLLELAARRPLAHGAAARTPLPPLAPIELPRGPRGIFPMRPALEIFRLGKTFDGPHGSVPVVEGFDLSIERGEFVCLLGHSGCGKSTVLSMVAGLSEITAGGVVLDGREIDGPGPDRGVVFQSPSLLPWLTALDNVRLGVDRVFPHGTRAQRRDIATHHLERVGLGGALARRPFELSQGECQRVGIARAFALAPKLLLLDEPFGMLDSLTRMELQGVLLELLARERKTALMVTHDVDEALFLADRIALMTRGPRARVGEIVEVSFPRPRERGAVLEHPDYYALRERLLEFLEEQDAVSETELAREAASVARSAA